MTIWLFCPKFPCVSESFIERQARALNATVYTKQINQNVKIPREIDVVELPDGKEPVQRSRWLRRIQREWQVARYKNTNLMPSFMEEVFLTDLIRLRPDVVLAQYGTTGLELMRPCAKANIPLVVHFHGFDLSRKLRDRWYRFSCRELIRRSQALIVVNHIQRERLLELGAQANKIFLIPCGVPIDEFTPSPRVADQPCRFIAVGRFTQKKCPNDTIRAFAECADANAEVHLTIIGDGPLYSECRQLADKLNVSQQIRFMKAQPNRVVREEMKKAGVFVQHSVTAVDGDEEGWPVAVGEAMASGLPVLSTRHPGIVDQVVHGETGFLVDEGDWRGMASQMVRLAEDAGLRVDMGKAGRQRIEGIGNMSHALGLLKEVLSDVVLSKAG